MFLNNDEIVKDILKAIGEDSSEVRQAWLDAKEDDLIMSHHATGRAIRNSYLMWDKNNPYSELEDSMHEDFPDQRSHLIITTVWKKLQEEADVSR